MKAHSLKWLFLSLVICAALSVLAALLPGPVKKLGLFSVLLGGLLAIGLFQLRLWTGKTAQRRDFWLVILLAMLTETGRIAETYRQFLAQQRASLEKQMQEVAGMAALLGSELQNQMQTGWLDFLRLRYSSLWNGSLDQQPLALVVGLFTLELLLAGFGAAFAWRWWEKSHTGPSELQSDTR